MATEPSFYYLEPKSFLGGDDQDFATLQMARHAARLLSEEKGCDVEICFHTEDENTLVEVYEFETLADYLMASL